MGLGFAENNKVTRVSNAVAAGTDDETDGTGLAMDGFETITFIFAFGTITASAVTTVKAQQSDDDASSDDYTDLEGSSISVADDDDNQLVVLEIKKPMKRYVRPVIVRATANAVIDGIVAIQSGPSVAPVENGATVVDTEVHVSPDEGTA